VPPTGAGEGLLEDPPVSTALVLAADGRRKGGKWDGAKGRSIIPSGSVGNEGTWKARVSEAGTVLDWMPDLAPQVAAGTVTSSDGTRGVLGQRGAMPIDRAMLHRYTRVRARDPHSSRGEWGTAGLLTAETRSLVIVTPLPA